MHSLSGTLSIDLKINILFLKMQGFAKVCHFGLSVNMTNYLFFTLDHWCS